jgi:hypothetical protein
MILLTLAGSTFGKWLRRVMLSLVPPPSRSNRDTPQEIYRFPPF